MNGALAFDAVVIGGGFAGVVAARELASAGNDVALLEGRDRLGGRTYSTTWHDETIELGGAWVHHLQPFLWAEVQRAGLRLRCFEAPDETWFNDGNGPRRIAEPDRAEFAAAWRRYLDGTSEGIPDPYRPAAEPLARAIDRQTMRERLDSLRFSDDTRARVAATLTAWANGAIDRAGALFCHRLFALSGYSAEGFDAIASSSVLAGGTGHLIEAMIGQAPVDV